MKTALAASLLVLTIISLPLRSHAAWWVNGNIICDMDKYQHSPVVVPDGSGGAIIVWGDLRNQGDLVYNGDIYAQRVNANGVVQWTANGVALCNDPLDQDLFTIVSDGSGGAIVAWQDKRNGSYDIYAQRINAAGAVQWTANGIVISNAANDQTTPIVIADGSGGAIVTWEDKRSGGPFDNIYDVYAQRINSLGVVQWTANGLAVCTATGNQYSPTLASDGSGGAIITWYDGRPGFSTDIYAQRINSTGVVQWTANGVGVCTVAENQTRPLIRPDGVGGAIIVWRDYHGSNDSTNDIYAQRINSVGATQWTPGGVALCTAIFDQNVESLETDGAGGVIMTWADRRAGTWAVYAGRLNDAGIPQWTANGVALSPALYAEGIPQITTDGAGGAIVTWPDYRAGFEFHVYAQRLNSAGAVQWSANGVALCARAGNQYEPAIISDGNGGAIVAWQELPNEDDSDDDIYATRVSGNGAIPTAVRPVTPSANLSVGASYPNPFTAETSLDVTLGRESSVSVEVFDVAGRRVRTIGLGRMPAGPARLTFDGLDDRKHALPSGVYFYRVRAGSETVTKKIVIAR